MLEVKERGQCCLADMCELSEAIEPHTVSKNSLI